MRKLSFLLVALMVVCLLQISPVSAQSWKYSSTHDINFTALDSAGGLKETLTDSLTGGTTGSPIFYYNNPNTKLMGVMKIYITARDSDDAAAQVADTTKDTIVATLYTAYSDPSAANTSGYSRLGETALCSLIFNTHIGTTIAASTAQLFSSPTTPLVGDVAYWRFRCAYLCPNNDDTVAIHYRVFVSEKTER